MTIDEFMRDVAPKMRPGWIAMQPDNNWCWFSEKPEPYICNNEKIMKVIINSGCGWDIPDKLDFFLYLECFDITPVDDWTKSLRKVGK